MTEQSAPVTRPLSSQRILRQLGVFLLGFVSLLVLHGVFTYLIHDLEKQTTNERARLFVGEQVVGDIRLVESGVYRMATTLGVRGQQRMASRLRELIAGIRHNLGVLRDGGVARQLLHLNLEGHEQMVKEVPYQPAPRADRGYILEIIDLTPKLREIETKIAELTPMLGQMETLRRRADAQGLFAQERRIKVFLKKLPPLFTRLTENANRMFFDSHRRLARIESRIAQRTRYYWTMELMMVILIIVSVMLLGLVFARRIERHNEQLTNARDRMRKAKEEAERANKAKSEFLSRMSHELRTPLNAVLGFSQLLATDPQLTDEQRDGVEEIDKAGRHLLDLISEILDLAKIEAGRLALEKIEYSITEVAQEIVGIMTPRAHDKGLELHASISPQLPGISVGDPTRLKQVLLNLLGNALKFTERGAVSLRIEPQPERRVIRFDIIDTGIGFDEATRQRLFQPFTQADESTTRRFGGSGLGLVICKELLQAMGGHIDAESSPGQGAHFWFELPLGGSMQPTQSPDERLTDHPATAPEGHAAALPEDSPQSPDRNGLRILLAEDQLPNQLVARSMLKRLGVTVQCVNDGQAAVTALQDGRYDLVFMDMQMPVMDGVEATRQIRRHEAAHTLPRIPVVAMTANAMEDDRQSCLRAGMDDHLPKPISLQSVEEKLRQWIPGYAPASRP